MRILLSLLLATLLLGLAGSYLFWLRDATALKAAEAFRQGGQFITAKGRSAKAFGIFNLIRFRLGWWKLDTAFRAISGRLELRAFNLQHSRRA